MILTVTPNIALDRLVVVRGFQTGRQSRAQFGFTQAGGSGVHASQVIQALGGDSKAICIIDPQQGSLVESVEAGPRCSSADLERLVVCLEANLAGCQLLVISGSLPPGLPPEAYAGMIALAGRFGVKTLADIHSDALSLGMQARPWLIKPNLGEFHQLLGRQTLDLPDLAQACLALRKETGTQIALSMERQGLLLTASQAQWWLRPPALEMHLPDGPGINVIGCGDALVGALAFEYCRTRDLLAAARLGLAAAHVNLGTYGSPEIDPLHARQLAEQVQALRL